MRLKLTFWFLVVFASVAVAQQSGFRVDGVGSGGASVAGADTQVQFNDAGSLGGDAGLTYAKTTDTLTVAATVKAEGVQDSGQTKFQLDGNGIVTISTGKIGFTSGGGTFNAIDTYFSRAGAGEFAYPSVLFAALGTPLNGAFAYCSDCTIANPCAGAGSGAFAKRLNGVWVCN